MQSFHLQEPQCCISRLFSPHLEDMSYLYILSFSHLPPEEQAAGGVLNSHKSQFPTELDLLCVGICC
ncbi:hypothetical protein GDO81_011020 [Engystomops pustulosus]|uniref:Uncharacterized protein n=1 Tax=Engystomops pustulosus TaxID=76066 RepID=A0AAV7C527_ENGPU|nr:hypothetical protein GDO81_011020 [Engystomops pustulosus]